MKARVGLSAGLFLAVAWAGAGGLLGQAPLAAVKMRNPFEGDERAQRAGAKLYRRECASCHGREREGIGKAPPLRAAALAGASAGALFWVLENGSLARGMPSFAHLPEAQRWQIVSFLHGEDRPPRGSQ